MKADTIADIRAAALNAPLNEPFAIAGSSKTEAQNVLVRVRLRNGVTGWGEGAPAFNDGSQKRLLTALRTAAARFTGRSAAAWRPLLGEIEEFFGPALAPAAAALSMAVLDAWCRSAKIPLRLIFGGAKDRLSSDITVTLAPPKASLAAARRIVKKGVRTIKIKVGMDLDEDEARVRAVNSAARGIKIILDANCGYSPRQSLRFLARLGKAGIRPILFEQPAAQGDWRGLKDVLRLGKTSVAADESAQSRKDALWAAKTRSVDTLNLKFMKSGILQSWDMALIAKASGLRLMIGGMVESPLAMGASAHFAAGLGGFDFVDLDTPLWFARNPMRGLGFGRGGLYDLSCVRSGIGVSPGGPGRLFPR